MGIDTSSRVEIESVAVDLRKRSGALTWEADIDDLIEVAGLEQGSYRGPDTLGSRARDLMRGILKKVKALLFVKDETILLSPDLPQAREPFAKAHELGHFALPWHKAILYACDEHDLAQSTRVQMEWEANTFASAVLFPAPLMESIYASFPTGMEAVLLLKDSSGASIESSAHAYVQHHPGVCLLMVLEEETDGGTGEEHLHLVRKRLSERAYGTRLRRLAREQDFPEQHVLYRRSRERSIVQSGHLEYVGRRYPVSIFNNGYRVLVILHDPEAS